MFNAKKHFSNFRAHILIRKVIFCFQVKFSVISVDGSIKYMHGCITCLLTMDLIRPRSHKLIMLGIEVNDKVFGYIYPQFRRGFYLLFIYKFRVWKPTFSLQLSLSYFLFVYQNDFVDPRYVFCIVLNIHLKALIQPK